MLRGLVSLLLLLASYVAPPALEGVATAALEVSASQLAGEQVAALDKSGPKISSPFERVPPSPGSPPGTPPTPAETSSALLVSFDCVEVVVHKRPPSEIPAAREVARRDQRPKIRRLKHRAPSLDTASSNA